MAETNPTTSDSYTYHVLVERSATDSDESWRRQFRRLIDLGVHPGRNGDEAIEHAVENGGLPREDGGRCIVVPVSRWHERDVTIEKVPQIRVDEPVEADPA